MRGSQTGIGFILKALGLAMAVASITLSILKIGNSETILLLLGIGLFALSMAAFRAN